MYDSALELGKEKIMGNPDAPYYYKKPYLDAAFNGDVFLWDTAFIMCWAKYHIDELPVYQSLDNFYESMDEDGFIARHYKGDTGKTAYPKEHPSSIAPPLLAFAELELESQKSNIERLRKVYPTLRKHHQYMVNTYQLEDGLFFSDALGFGMDDIKRYSYDWEDDGKGLPFTQELYGEIYDSAKRWNILNSMLWNVQGRCVDLSAQMAFNAQSLAEIAKKIGQEKDVAGYIQFSNELKDAINQHCWSEKDGFYFDLGYDHIKRFHIGMYWMLMAKLVPEERMEPFIAHLSDPKKFASYFPITSLSVDVLYTFLIP